MVYKRWWSEADPFLFLFQLFLSQHLLGHIHSARIERFDAVVERRL